MFWTTPGHTWLYIQSHLVVSGDLGVEALGVSVSFSFRQAFVGLVHTGSLLAPVIRQFLSLLIWVQESCFLSLL